MAEYQEFTEPVDPKTGKRMSEEKRKKYKEAIRARENPTSRLIRDLPRASQFLRETVGDVKRRTKEVAGDIGEFGAAAAEGVGEVIKAPFEYRAALATDPKGTMAATKEFGSRVMSGDPEARRQTAEGVSMSMVEPFATAADAELARQDLAKGDYTGAAISGASVLLPFVSAGWLKTAMRKGDVPSEAAEKVAELERRVDAGEVTDDMQIRRELAMIEDDHMADYYGGSPSEEMGRIQEDDLGPADAGVPDPEDLSMERQQDYYEGITTDMRGTPRGGMETFEMTPEGPKRFDQGGTPGGGGRFVLREDAKAMALENLPEGWLKEAIESDGFIPDQLVEDLNEAPSLHQKRKMRPDDIRRDYGELQNMFAEQASYGPGGHKLTEEEKQMLRRRIAKANEYLKENPSGYDRRTGDGSINYDYVNNDSLMIEQHRDIDQYMLDNDTRFEAGMLMLEPKGSRGTPRGGSGGGSNYKLGTWSDQYRKSGYTQAHHDRYRLLKKAEDDAFDKVEREGFEPGSQEEDDFLQSMFDENLANELLELETIRATERRGQRGRGRVPEFTEDTGIDQYKELVMSYADEGRPFSFTEVFTDPSQPFDQDLYKAVDELIAEGRISGPTTDLKLDKFGRVLNHDTMIYTKAPGRGGRGIDDLEGPSEEEIRSMVAQDQAGALKFGDAEEYAMMMEDLRRGAGQVQQEIVDRARIGRSRTPMKPGTKAPGANPGEGQPEGTARAERRGPPRERPGLKKK